MVLCFPMCSSPDLISFNYLCAFFLKKVLLYTGMSELQKKYYKAILMKDLGRVDLA